jgi:hypothetical protein
MIAQDAPPTPPVPALEDRTEHEGWLHKRSDRFKTWNKRWFILRDSSLFYFKNPKVGVYCPRMSHLYSFIRFSFFISRTIK